MLRSGQIDGCTETKTKSNYHNNSQTNVISQKTFTSYNLNKISTHNFTINNVYSINNIAENTFRQQLSYGQITSIMKSITSSQQIYSSNLEFNQDNSLLYDKSSVQIVQMMPANVLEILQQNIINLSKGQYVLQDQNLLATIGMRLIENGFYLIKYLTSGGQGDIFIGEENGCQVILKIYSKIQVQEFQEEIELITSIKTPINILGNLKSLLFNDINIFVVVQEICEMSLKDELAQFKNHEKEFKFSHFLQIIFDLLDGLIEMRSHIIVHQDIKPANILKKYSRDYVYIDFGCASKYRNGEVMKKGYTPNYCSPEQKLNGDVSYQSDVYSLGRSFEEIISSFKLSTEYNNQLNQNIIIQFEQLIKDKMLVNKEQEREEIMDILIEFFQVVNIQECLEFNKRYDRKIQQLIESFPFDNSKDIHYFQKVHLYYSIMHVYTLFIIYGSNQQIKISEFIINCDTLNFFSQNIKNEVIASSFINVGNCYQSLGQFNVALKFFEASLEINQTIFPNANSHVSQSLCLVGSSYQNLGKYELALNFYLKSLEMRQIIFPENDPCIAYCLNYIGLCYESLGQYDIALKYMIKTLEIKKIHYIRNHFEIADSYNNLGLCYQSLGQYDLSLENYHQSLDINTNIYQLNHPKIAINLNNIGYCYQTLGKYELSLDFLSKALEMRKILFIKNHPSVALSYHNVGNTYLSLGKYDKAFEHLQESLEIRRIILPPNHMSTANTLNTIGLCYKSTGQFELALQFMQEGLQMFNTVFSGKMHAYTSKVLSSIGMCYLTMGETEMAQNYLLQSFEMNKQIYSVSHPALADSLNNLGKYDLALTYFLESHEMKKTLLKQDHPNMISCLNDIINFFQQFGQQNIIQDILKNDQILLLRFMNTDPQIKNVLEGILK